MIFIFSPKSYDSNEMINSQADALGIPAFLNNAKEYTDNSFKDLDLNSVFESGIKGKLNISGIIGIVIELFGNELKDGISGVIAILIVIIIHSLLKSIIENLTNSNIGQIAYFVQFLAIVSIIIANFTDVLLVTRNSTSEMINFIRLFIPMLITLMFVSGGIASSSGIGAILIFFMNLIGTIIEVIVIPLIMCGTILGIVNAFSDKSQISGLSKFMKSACLWILGIILTLFICSLSLQGILSQSVDGVTSKTAKAAISNFIPFVGKIMGDSIDTVIGCTNILKNTFGIIGVIIFLGIAIAPIIKVTIMWFGLRIVFCICEIIADSKIIKLLEDISDSYKMLFGILVSCSIMFVIGITIVLRMTNIAI